MTPGSFATHAVLNQSPPFVDVDLFALDRPLSDAVVANGGAAAHRELSEFGQRWGSAAMAERDGSPTRTRQNCGRSIPKATGGTKSSFIRPITN